ncbi:MAG TPA: ABC transporter substrate-binding protein [Anaeromyxobacteraceae bacterium]|nr:ABC transporter substrate-binding protein [Anaeromyxobacteraceae bacterium]
MRALGITGLALATAAALAGGTASGTEKLKVGYLPVTGHAKFFVAADQGFFAQEGLDVELVEFVNSADGLNALVSGKLDLGAFGTTAPLVHISRGTDLRIIGGVMGEDAAVITTPANAGVIKGVADLRGKKVATVRLASGDAVLRGALHDAGIDWKKDLKIFELKNPPAVIEAVKTGQVDAGVVWGPHDFRAEQQGLRVVVRSNVLQAGHPCCRLTIRADELQARARWVKFVRAILRAEKFTREDRPRTLDAIVKHLKLDRALVEKAFYSGFLEQASDPNLKGVRRFWAAMLQSEFITTTAAIDPHVELAVYKEALDGLAKENPKDRFWAELQQKYAARNL